MQVTHAIVIYYLSGTDHRMDILLATLKFWVLRFKRGCVELYTYAKTVFN